MRRLPLAGLALLLCARAAPCAWAGPPTFEAVRVAFEEGRLSDVVRLADALPDDVRARYLAGEARLVLGAPQPAEAEFRFVLSKRQKALPAAVGLGRALSAQGRHEEALATLHDAVALDAKDVAARRSLGEALLAAGQRAEGVRSLEAALQAAPSDPATVRALVEARLTGSELAEAKTLAQRFAKAAPKSALGDFLVALVLDRAGDADAAIAAYEKALKKDEAFLDAHKNLAILCHARSDTYANVERVKKAFLHYERYFALGGADAQLRTLFETLKSFAPQLGIPTK